MADISSISRVGPTASITTTARVGRPEANLQEPAAADQVEISEIARLLGALDPGEQSGIRAQKVADIREAIASGTYETPDKIDYVAGRLMDIFQAAPEA
jgi:anti-sigma28 factor (negative regulator of flagellin synthesis)